MIKKKNRIKVNIIKILLICVALVLVWFSIRGVSYSVLSLNKKTFNANSISTYDYTIKSLREISYAFYMRGNKLQYNSNKRSTLEGLAPEDATSQNREYLVCTGFTHDVYEQLLGIDLPIDASGFLTYTKNNIATSTTQANGRPEVIAYGAKNGSTSQITFCSGGKVLTGQPIENPDLVKNIIPRLRVGDILTFTGHSVMVYDLIKDENGKNTDAIIMQAIHGTSDLNINTKLQKSLKINTTSTIGTDTGLLFHCSKLNSDSELVQQYGITNSEGTLNLQRLSENAVWSNISTKIQNGTEFSIVRFIDKKKDSNGTELGAVLNYKDDNNNKNYQDTYIYSTSDSGDSIKISASAKDRVKYSHLYIEKTVDKNDDNLVKPSTNLTYKIVVKNSSLSKYTNDLVVTENLSNLVTYTSGNYTVSDTIGTVTENIANKKIQWNLGKLDSGKEITIRYTVQVNANTYGQTVESTGTVGNISSGTIKNKIGNVLTSAQKTEIQNKYNSLKSSYQGKDLINRIYSGALNVDLGLGSFNIENLITIKTQTSSGTYIKPYAENSLALNTSNKFSPLILNNYWSALMKIDYDFEDTNTQQAILGDTTKQKLSLGKDSNGNTIYNNRLKRWKAYSNSARRADTIYEAHFQTGDILIYKNSNDVTYTKSGNSIIPTTVTNENGEYAYIYIEGEGFVGINYGKDGKTGTADDRNSFNVSYYTDNGLNIMNKSQSQSWIESNGTYMNNQTLLGKDYYVILRPSLGFDVTPPGVSVTYSTTSATNQNVTATITANEQVQSVSGWTLSSDKKILTKSYTANATESVTVKDLAGNSKAVQIKITNIDKTAPTLSVSYSTTALTDQNVIATITANEQVQSVSGWTLSSDKKILTKSYSANLSETITVYDLAGNKKTINVKIENISAIKIGDLNENDRIDIGDLVLIHRHISAINKESVAAKHPEWILSAEKVALGDLNKNGRLDIGDGLKIQRYISASNSTEVALKHPDWLIVQ